MFIRYVGDNVVDEDKQLRGEDKTEEVEERLRGKTDKIKERDKERVQWYSVRKTQKTTG